MRLSFRPGGPARFRRRLCPEISSTAGWLKAKFFSSDQQPTLTQLFKKKICLLFPFTS
jgi:hypothetical protein